MLIQRIQKLSGKRVALRSFNRRYKFSIPGTLGKVDREKNRFTVELTPSIWREMELIGGGQYFVHVGEFSPEMGELWFSARAVGIYQLPSPGLELEICTPETADTQSQQQEGIEIVEARTATALRMSEINLSGAILTTTHRLGEVNDRLQIALSNCMNDGTLQLDCKISHLHHKGDTWRYGIRFDQLDGDAVELIRRIPRPTPPDCA